MHVRYDSNGQIRPKAKLKIIFVSLEVNRKPETQTAPKFSNLVNRPKMEDHPSDHISYYKIRSPSAIQRENINLSNLSLKQCVYSISYFATNLSTHNKHLKIAVFLMFSGNY